MSYFTKENCRDNIRSKGLPPTEKMKKRWEDMNQSARLNEIEAKIKDLGGQIKNNHYALAKLLAEAKAHPEISEGNGFQLWFKTRFPDLGISRDKALDLVRAYAVCLGSKVLFNSLPISLLYQVTAPSFPEEVRKFLFDNSHELRNIKNKELKEISEKFKAGVIDMDSDEIQGLRDFANKVDTAAAYRQGMDKAIDSVKQFIKMLEKQRDASFPSFPNLKVIQKIDREKIVELSKEAHRVIKDAFTDILNLKTINEPITANHLVDVEIQDRQELENRKAERAAKAELNPQNQDRSGAESIKTLRPIRTSQK